MPWLSEHFLLGLSDGPCSIDMESSNHFSLQPINMICHNDSMALSALAFFMIRVEEAHKT